MTTPTVDRTRVLAAEHYAQRRTLIVAVIEAIAEWWAYISRSDITGTWQDVVSPGLLDVVQAAQRAAAAAAPDYMDAIAAELGGRQTPYGDLIPDAWADGTTADGRDLDDLLDVGRQHTLRLIAGGSPVTEALDSGLLVVQRAAVTETQDAGRTADGVALAAQPLMTGYVRYLQLPSCARCVILAGRWYRWSAGFQRHERCDCLHVPTAVASDPANDEGNPAADPLAAVRSGQVEGLSQADLQAVLEDGADLGRIVNRKSQGLSIAADGTRKRGRKLTPEAIYKRAGDDRDAALRMLARAGYITAAP